MNLNGVILNPILIIFGSLIGIFFGEKIPWKIRNAIYLGLGLCIVYLGIEGIQNNGNIINAILAIIISGAIGEWIDIDGRLNNFGHKIEKRLKKTDERFSAAFVNGTLLFCTGTMGITGAIESGMLGNPSTLIAKSFIDMIIALVVATNLGFGVLASSISVFFYQLLLTLLSVQLSKVLTTDVVYQISYTGGILIMGVGLNMLEVTDIKIGNFMLSPFMCIPLMKIPFLQ